MVVLWIIKPLFDLPGLSSVLARIVLSLGFLCAVLGYGWWELTSGDRQRAKEESEFKARFEPHRQHFSRLCADAGTRIFRSVEGIESIAFDGVRARTARADLEDPGFVGDVYSQFDTVDNPREALARAFVTKREWEERWYVPKPDEFLRYPQVEIRGELDGQIGYFRYTDASRGSLAKLKQEFAPIAESQYVVRIQDVTTQEDRQHWIVGTKWTVVHLPTGEVLGESLSYAIDTLQGQTRFSGGFGSAGEPWAPWLRAGHAQYDTYKVGNACPRKDGYQRKTNNLDFLRTVLVPVQQEMKLIPR